MTADLIPFPVPSNVKVIPGGSTLTASKRGAIGRPRTRRPRPPRIVPVWLEADEIKALQAKPVAALPAAKAEDAIPPFQRLSLAKQIEITYRRQQAHVTQKIADKRDRLVHTEQVLNWRVEVWQKGATHSGLPLFFYRTECLTVGAVGGSKGKSRIHYSTPQRCLEVARWKVRERETLWRRCGRPVSRKQRHYTFRRYARPITLPPNVAVALDPPLTVAEMLRDEATCPICRRTVMRRRSSLRSHFQPHVSAGALQSREVDELLSFLVAS